jgi:hypothetical protein
MHTNLTRELQAVPHTLTPHSMPRNCSPCAPYTIHRSNKRTSQLPSPLTMQFARQPSLKTICQAGIKLDGLAKTVHEHYSQFSNTPLLLATIKRLRSCCLRSCTQCSGNAHCIVCSGNAQCSVCNDTSRFGRAVLPPHTNIRGSHRLPPEQVTPSCAAAMPATTHGEKPAYTLLLMPGSPLPIPHSSLPSAVWHLPLVTMHPRLLLCPALRLVLWVLLLRVRVLPAVLCAGREDTGRAVLVATGLSCIWGILRPL